MITAHDVGHLSDAALLDIISGNDGAGSRLLAGDDVSGIYRLAPHAIAERAGVPESDARRIAAAFTIGHRIRSRRERRKPVLDTIGDVVDAIKHHARLEVQESAWIAALDPSQRLLGVRCVAVGTAHKIAIDTTLVLRHAVELGSSAILLCHLHVDGDQHPPKPSLHDYIFTGHLRQLAYELGIILLDHFVIASSGQAVSVLRLLEAKEKAERRRKERAAKKARARRKAAKKAKVQR